MCCTCPFSIFSNYWQKNLTKNGTRGFGFSDARSQCIASFCPRGFFFSANYADTGSGIVQCAMCKEQARSTLLRKLALHETPNFRGNILCESTLHTNVHKHKTQQTLQKMPTSPNTFAQIQAHGHTAHADQPGKQESTHTRTPAALCTRTSTSTVAQAGTRGAAVGTWQEGKERLSAAGATYMQR